MFTLEINDSISVKNFKIIIYAFHKLAESFQLQKVCLIRYRYKVLYIFIMILFGFSLVVKFSDYLLMKK